MDLSPLKIPLNAPVYYQNFQELYYSFISTTTMATETPKKTDNDMRILISLRDV